jgi:protein-S-isoprenylcysteine O-methyltransferase Ste14
MKIVLTVTGAIWLIFELGLIARDRQRGTGGTGRDRGTRVVNFILIAVAILLADALTAVIGKHSPLRIPGAGPGGWPLIAGLVVVWLGLVIRVWAVVVLGRSFRTTVEVDAAQPVESRGPYRWVRHPSYTGLLLIAAGYGLALGTWPGLAICLVLPAAALLRRIQVEEAELTRVLGDPYRDYREHTKRLIPGVW